MKKNTLFYLILIVIAFIGIIFLYNSGCNKSDDYSNNSDNDTKDKWYEGGTLHKSQISVWKIATDKNKLATCADFMAKIDNTGSMDELKRRATKLKACIDEATRGLENTNKLKVSDVAASCTSGERSKTDKIQKTIIVPESLYKIISEIETVNPKFGINKCNIAIELKKKLSEDELKEVALKLRSTRQSYDYLWIFYLLPGMQSGAGSWATSHFTPDLKVEIGGTTAAEDKKLEAIKVDGKVIGKWQDTRPYAPKCLMILLEKNNKIYMNHAYGDGSSYDEEFIKKQIKGKTRYELKQNKHKEYYIIEANGNLGMYGNDGKFGEAIKKK